MVCPIPYGDHKKLNPGSVAYYNLLPGNRVGRKGRHETSKKIKQARQGK